VGNSEFASLGSSGHVIITGVTTIVKSKLPKMDISAQSTQGSILNPRLLRNKELEFAVINADSAYPAVRGEKPYKEPVNMLYLFTNYTNSCLFVTRKDTGITSMEQLKGKRVSVGPPGSGGLMLATSVIKHGYGLWDNIKKVYLAYNDQGAALKDKKVDAMMAHCNNDNPASYLNELDSTTSNLYYLGISEEALKRIQAAEAYQFGNVLNAGSMKNLDRDILTMTNAQMNFARADIPEDVVYAIMKAFFDNATELDKFHALGKNLRPETAMNGALKEIPVHPGAAKYYKEKGVWREGYKVGTVKN
jgi:TRAP transporter TAXI family solute receptor